MDQLIFASLSHTHYWYEVGMLKVPADNIANRVGKNSDAVKGGSYGNKILYKNLDLTQDFPNKISFHF